MFQGEAQRVILSAAVSESLDYEHSAGGSTEDESRMEVGPASTDALFDSTLSQGSSVPQPWDGPMVQAIQSVMEKQAASIMQGVEEQVRKTLRAAGVLRPGGGNRAKSGSSGASCSGGCHGRRRGSDVRERYGERRAGAELIELFDPESRDSNVDRWLNKIDQLGRIHDWTDYERTHFMQLKLAGPAKAWFHRLDEYDRSWAEWKNALRRAFPRRHDFAEMVEELVARKKIATETMTQYFHAKLALCERCRFTGKEALSFIIRGLPLELQANARAFKCRTADELYSGFLADLDHYQETSRRGPDLKRRLQEKVQAHRSKGWDLEGKGSTTAKRLMVRCYNCQELGTHLSRDCTKPKVTRCMRCGRTGHIASSCRGGVESTSRRTQAKDSNTTARLINPNNSGYRKVACGANGEHILVYLDTGSELTSLPWRVSRECR